LRGTKQLATTQVQYIVNCFAIDGCGSVLDDDGGRSGTVHSARDADIDDPLDGSDHTDDGSTMAENDHCQLKRASETLQSNHIYMSHG
jgi:hypothetical protein